MMQYLPMLGEKETISQVTTGRGELQLKIIFIFYYLIYAA